MKKVFTNSEICHVFNMQHQNDGRNTNNSLYFLNNKLYSYGRHYLLCEFINPQTVIINDTGYSNTTSKHISLILNATRNRKQYFKTCIDPIIVNNSIKKYLKKITRARERKTFYFREIRNIFNMYFNYIEETKQKTSFLKIKEHRENLKMFSLFQNNSSSLEEDIKKDQILREQVKVKKWKNGEIDFFKNNTKSDFLRIKNGFVETSQNVKITIDEAKRLLILIDQNNIIGQKVSNLYTVLSWYKFLKIGCHNISLEEINYIKKILN